MSVIEDSKKVTLESTAKMIASSAEKQKVQNTVLGNTKEITCDSVAKINKGDYADCNIEFEDNRALVTIKGSGKFDGLWVCNGTKTSAEAQKESCSSSCMYNLEESKYEVNDVESCVTYLKDSIISYRNYVTESQVRDLCQEKNIYNEYEDEEGNDATDLIYGPSYKGEYIYSYIYHFIEIGQFTEQELIDNNVINKVVNNICVKEETPENCFEYENMKDYEIDNVDECASVILNPMLDECPLEQFGDCESKFGECWSERTECVNIEDAKQVCAGNKFSTEGNSAVDLIHYIIRKGNYTEQQLIDSSVIKIVNENTITSYDETCGLDLVTIPKKINNSTITRINSSAFNGNIPNRIIFSETITKYDQWFFSNIEEPIQHVYLANSNVKIGNCAFAWTQIKYHNIPAISCIAP